MLTSGGETYLPLKTHFYLHNNSASKKKKPYLPLKTHFHLSNKNVSKKEKKILPATQIRCLTNPSKCW